MYNNFPKKVKMDAQRMVNEAVAAGIIEATGPCVWCGTTQNIVKHHYNYHLPLDIVYMCRSCHGEVHNRHRRITKTMKKLPSAESAIVPIDGGFEVHGYGKPLFWFKTENEAVMFVHTYLENQIDVIKTYIPKFKHLSKKTVVKFSKHR